MQNSAVINLVNLRHNAKSIKKLLPKNVRFCAVVKADAYGHGAAEVANALYGYVDCFAVALAEEGVLLRNSGIKKDILLLIPPFYCDIERVVRYDLTVAVSDVGTAKRLNREGKKQHKKIKVHIKVNTGMNRQGVNDISELKGLCAYIASARNLVLEGVFSHFARPENEKSRKSALNNFLLAIKCVKEYNENVISHISASGGLLAGVTLDMVRIGIMLYGYTPFKTDKIKLKRVMNITSPVVTNRYLKRGDHALYGDTRVKKSGNYSLYRCGYADGVMRKNIRGQHGNRCMDLTLSYGKTPKKKVEILGDAQFLAKQYKTISYEILCKASIRAERIYRR